MPSKPIFCEDCFMKAVMSLAISISLFSMMLEPKGSAPEVFKFFSFNIEPVPNLEVLILSESSPIILESSVGLFDLSTAVSSCSIFLERNCSLRWHFFILLRERIRALCSWRGSEPLCSASKFSMSRMSPSSSASPSRIILLSSRRCEVVEK